MKIIEKCSCGATFESKGIGAQRAATLWRLLHQCPNNLWETQKVNIK